MTNPLSNPNDWVDQEFNTPPSQWNGVAYEWFGQFGAGLPEQFIDFIGDTGSVPASFAVSVSTGAENLSIPHALRVVWNMDSGEVVETEGLTPETTAEFTFTKPAGTLNGLFIQVTSNGSEYPYAYSMDVAVTPIAQEDPIGSCEELGRATRAYVSGYNRTKTHVTRLRRQERRCVVADFNGAIPVNRSIVAVTWRCVQPWVTKMSNAAISGRQAQVTVDFQNPGFGPIKATVELDNGELYNQLFEFTVTDAPYFLEGTPVQGPYLLTATV